MARVVPVQTNFTAGEFSPRLLGREDIERYKAAVATLDNWRVMPHGGVTKRPGRTFVAECYDSTKRSRLMPFEHDVTTAYILEMAQGKMRVFKDSGQVLSLGVPYEISTPFLEAELFELQNAQQSDVMYIAHKSHWPRKLSRTSDTSWALQNVVFTDGPYLPDNTTAITMQPSAVSGAGITITASAPYFNANMAPVSGEPGALIRIKHGATWGYARIVGYTDSQHVTADVKSAFGATTAQTTWAEGAWSTYRGFPRSVTFFEQRLYLGGTDYQPQTLWGSAAGFYEDMTPGAVDSSAINYTIGNQKRNTIQWMLGGDVLYIGTSGAEFTAGSPDSPLTPTNVKINPQTKYGSTYMQPVEASSVLLFVTRSKRKLRELQFEFRSNAYKAPDLSLLAEHITRGGITQIAYATDPDPILFATRADGMLLSLTYDREQEIVAWGKETTLGTTESVAVIPEENAAGEGYSQVWVISNRTIGGATKRYVEYYAEPFESDDDIESAFYVDSGLTYDGAPATTLSGLDHLEGEEVQILGDGAVFTPQTVTGGAVTVSPAVSRASVGLPYVATLKTLPGITGAQDGTTQGRRKSWGRAGTRLHDTVGMTVNGYELQFRDALDAMDTATPPFTGTRKVQLSGWDDEAQVDYVHNLPLPATILSLFGVLQVEEE